MNIQFHKKYRSRLEGSKGDILTLTNLLLEPDVRRRVVETVNLMLFFEDENGKEVSITFEDLPIIPLGEIVKFEEIV